MTTIILFAVLLFVAIGFALWSFLRAKRCEYLLNARVQQQEETIAQLRTNLSDREERIANETDRRIEAEKELTRTRTDCEHIARELAEAREQSSQIGQELRQQFELLSHRLLDESRQKIAEHQEAGLKQLLSPLQTELQNYRQELQKADKEQQQSRIQIGEQIRMLVEQTGKVGREAAELAKAMKGNSKVQGDWGEAVLSRLLEANGMDKHLFYEEQVTIRSQDGRLIRSDKGERSMRPDVVLSLPQGRQIVIDSKVSLTAYSRYYEADTAEQAERELKEHVASLRKHIRELSDKEYVRYLKQSASGEIPDFCLLFVPIEAALHAALGSDNSLWEEAYRKQIILVGPLELIPVLKIVSDLWVMHKQQQNVREIMDRVAKMYDKLVLVDEAFTKAESGIESARKQMQETRKRFSQGRDNLCRQFDHLVGLGVAPSKRLPQREPLDSEAEQTDVDSLG